MRTVAKDHDVKNAEVAHFASMVAKNIFARIAAGAPFVYINETSPSVRTVEGAPCASMVVDDHDARNAEGLVYASMDV